MPDILALGKLRQEQCCEFEVSLGYIAKPDFKAITKTKDFSLLGSFVGLAMAGR